MKKILILDDEHWRHSGFKKLIDGRADVDHVETASEAINKLQSKYYDIVFLDHDLPNTDKDNTGMTVVYFIKSEAEFGVQHCDRVVVHSWNFDAAKAMVSTLLASPADLEVRRWWFDPNDVGFFDKLLSEGSTSLKGH